MTGAQPVLAALPPVRGLPPDGAQPAVPLRPPGPAGHIEGFRTARFGMSEADVTAALKADLPITDDKLQWSVHPSERTRILTARLAELAPFPGPVSINYIFGAHSDLLIQVSVVWTLPGDAPPGMAVRLALAGRAYAQRMASYRWTAVGGEAAPIATAADAPEQTSSLIEAYDARGARVELTAQPMPADQPGFHQLLLSFSQKPGDPDVFKIKPGEF